MEQIHVFRCNETNQETLDSLIKRVNSWLAKHSVFIVQRNVVRDEKGEIVFIYHCKEEA